MQNFIGGNPVLIMLINLLFCSQRILFAINVPIFFWIKAKGTYREENSVYRLLIPLNLISSLLQSPSSFTFSLPFLPSLLLSRPSYHFSSHLSFFTLLFCSVLFCSLIPSSYFISFSLYSPVFPPLHFFFSSYYFPPLPSHRILFSRTTYRHFSTYIYLYKSFHLLLFFSSLVRVSWEWSGLSSCCARHGNGLHGGEGPGEEQGKKRESEGEREREKEMERCE